MLDTMERMSEDHAEWLQTIYNTTEGRHFDCPVCANTYSEHDGCWRLPHPVAMHLSEHDAYVCSERCVKKWCIEHFEDIEEWESKQ